MIFAKIYVPVEEGFQYYISAIFKIKKTKHIYIQEKTEVKKGWRAKRGQGQASYHQQ